MKRQRVGSSPTLDETWSDIQEPKSRKHSTSYIATALPSSHAINCIPKHVNSVFAKRDIKPELRSLMINIWVGAFLAVLGIGLALLDNQMCYKNNFKQSSITDALRAMVFAVSLLHWIVIYRYYCYHTKIAEAYGEIYPKSNSHLGSIFAPQGHRRSILIDLLSVSFFTPPTMYNKWEYKQIGTVATLSLDDLLLVLVLMRCLQLFKLFYLASALFNRRDSFIL